MTRPTLAQLGVPEPFSGVCVHATPASEGDTFQDPVQAKQYIDYLWNHGVGGVKTFGSTTKQEIAHQAVLKGMLPMHRWWRGHRIGAPDYCTPDAEISQYVAAGCKIQELHNEPNLADEWDEGPYHGLPPYDQIPNILWTDWLKFADNCNRVGAYAMFPALSPGGNWDHRNMLNALLEWGIQHNYMGRVQDNVIAQHPRGHNFDRDVLYSPTMTCSWDEYRRNIKMFKDAGADTWHIASEWGWSLGNQADPARPRVTLPFWYEQNRETWMRMNPNSDKPVEPEMLALCYWVQGDPTDWGQDSIDQGRMDMPAPSPLWIDMEQHPEWYRWSRYGSTPPVVDYAKGFDCSSYQGDINWVAVSEEFSFVIIRASAGLTADEKYNRNYDAAGEHGMLRGAYHYLRQELTGQAKFFFDTCGARIPELGYYMDLEQAELTADKCQLALETTDTWTKQITNIYTRASFFNKFGSPSWAQGRKLWVAHWGVDKPTLPQAWSMWEFWQTGQGPVAGQTMDLDVYNGDEESLYDNYGSEEPPVDEVKIYDANDVEQNWEWLWNKYGTGVHIEASTAESYWRLVEIQEITDGSNVCFIEAEPGTKVIWNWPDAPTIPAGYNTEWGTKGDVAITDANWSANFGMWQGSYYNPATQKKGPHNVWCGASEERSEQMVGIGMLAGSNHWHLNLTWVWREGDGPPIPDDWERDTTERLDRMEVKIDDLRALVNHIHDIHCGSDPT